MRTVRYTITQLEGSFRIESEDEDLASANKAYPGPLELATLAYRDACSKLHPEVTSWMFMTAEQEENHDVTEEVEKHG